MRFLCLEMGLNLKDESKSVPINFTKDEINLYMKRFRALDTDNKGFITTADLRSYFKVWRQCCLDCVVHQHTQQSGKSFQRCPML